MDLEEDAGLEGGFEQGRSTCEDDEMVEEGGVWVLASFTVGCSCLFGSDASRREGDVGDLTADDRATLDGFGTSLTLSL